MGDLKLTKLKNNRYKINCGGIIVTTYDDVILKKNLLYKKELDKKLLDEVIEETTFYDNYYLVLKFTLKKVRCSKEVNDYIDSLDISNAGKDKIKYMVKEKRIINDKFFAESYINDKWIFSKDSMDKIRADLIKMEIKDEIIDNIILDFNFNEKEKLRKIIIKKINSNHNNSNNILKLKIINELSGLGYQKDDIVNIFNEECKDDYDNLLKEYNKLYTKYSKKMCGDTLIFKLKQSLYRKGFNYESIKKEDLN